MKIQIAMTRTPQVGKNDWLVTMQTGNRRSVVWGYTVNGKRTIAGSKSILVNDTLGDYIQRRLDMGYQVAAVRITFEIVIVALPAPTVYNVYAMNDNSLPSYRLTDMALAQTTAALWSRWFGHEYIVEHENNGEVVYANLYRHGEKRC